MTSAASVIFVFKTTAETMTAESLWNEAGHGGALVLKPQGLIGNCGLALQVGAADSAALLKLLDSRNIVPAGVYSTSETGRWEAVDSE